MEIAFVCAGQCYVLEVQRDDGALIRVRGPGKSQPPHDLVHHAVEYELDRDRGFRGKVAHGEVPDGGRLVLDWPPRGRRAEPQCRKQAARVR